jgi:hypothetical protein
MSMGENHRLGGAQQPTMGALGVLEDGPANQRRGLSRLEIHMTSGQRSRVALASCRVSARGTGRDQAFLAVADTGHALWYQVLPSLM